MGRREGISETPYRGIVEALNSITNSLNKINSRLIVCQSALNTQTKYLELITRKYSKKLYKKNFGKKK